MFFANYRIALSRLFSAIILLYVVFVPPPQIFSPFLLEAGELIGFILLATAAFGRIWCLLFISGKKNEALMTYGPYSMVRNPLYVFSFLGIVGFGLTVENPLLAFILAIVFAAYYPFTVRNEERRLESFFGASYKEYCKRTPRWIPDFRLYHQPEMLTVSPAKIGRDMLDAMWFLWVFVFWQVIELFRQFWPVS